MPVRQARRATVARVANVTEDTFDAEVLKASSQLADYDPVVHCSMLMVHWFTWHGVLGWHRELTFLILLLQADKTVLVDFWSNWCGPCKLVAPIMDWADKVGSSFLR